MRMILILKRESFSFANAKNSHLENFQKKAKAENAKAVFLPKPKLPKPILQKSQSRFFLSEKAKAESQSRLPKPMRLLNFEAY